MPSSGLEWAALSLVAFIGGGIGTAFFLYLRTAYRKAGWREVRFALALAVFCLVALYFERSAGNDYLQMVKEALKRITR